jgi:hypothetical protein
VVELAEKESKQVNGTKETKMKPAELRPPSYLFDASDGWAGIKRAVADPIRSKRGWLKVL